MHHEQRPFINAIIANPEDDAPRLVYADWLDEHDDTHWAPCPNCSKYSNDPKKPFGEPGYHPERDVASGRHEGGWANCWECNSRGVCKPGFIQESNKFAEFVEFIRLQIALKDVPKQALKMYSQDCMCQTCQTINRIKHLNTSVRDQLRLTPHIFDKCEHGFDWTFWGSTPECPQIVRRRGFVDEIRCKVDEWMSKGPYIVQLHPITQVTLSDFKPWTGQSDPDNYFIFDAGCFDELGISEGIIDSGIFDKLKGKKHIYDKTKSFFVSNCTYATNGDALADLSQACIAWAKSQLPTALLSSSHGKSTTTTTPSTSQRAEAEPAAIADRQK